MRDVLNLKLCRKEHHDMDCLSWMYIVYSSIKTFLFCLFCIFSDRLKCVGHSFGNIALSMIFGGCLDSYPVCCLASGRFTNVATRPST
jgi:hypothetical protein